MHIRSSKEKAAKRRKESKILHMVRMHDVARDGHCRFAKDFAKDYRWNGLSVDEMHAGHFCDGPSELAHLEDQKRFKTRGRSAELRHTTAGTAMLCKRHHEMYDGKRSPRLRLTLLSNAGADGELQWRFA